MFRFFRRRSTASCPSASNEPPRLIDPDDLFPDDGLWESRPSPEPTAIWRIVTPAGIFYADACAVEIVEGALHLLDAEEEVIGRLEPGAWERLCVFRPTEAQPAAVQPQGPDLDAAA